MRWLPRRSYTYTEWNSLASTLRKPSKLLAVEEAAVGDESNYATSTASLYAVRGPADCTHGRVVERVLQPLGLRPRNVTTGDLAVECRIDLVRVIVVVTSLSPRPRRVANDDAYVQTELPLDPGVIAGEERRICPVARLGRLEGVGKHDALERLILARYLGVSSLYVSRQKRNRPVA